MLNFEKNTLPLAEEIEENMFPWATQNKKKKYDISLTFTHLAKPLDFEGLFFS